MPLVLHQNINDSTSLGIWKITESAGRLTEALLLDEDDKQYVGTFKNESRKRHWLSYRLILRKLLPSTNTKIVYDEYGKPYMPFYKGNFSVSHSVDYAAAIVSSDLEVGIDIEKIGDRIKRVAERFLSPDELSWTGNSDPAEKLLICWGAKESIYKIAGKPDADFQKDIRIEPFDYLCIGEGACQAGMKTTGKLHHFDVFYRKIEDYMLVWAVQK